MSWFTLQMLIDLVKIIIIGSPIYARIYFFYVRPYRHYFNFRDELTRSGMKISHITHNTSLSQLQYDLAFDEISNWLGEINIIKNKLQFNNLLTRFGIPSNEELDEAIRCAVFIRNDLGQQDKIVDTINNYQRLMEIFDINQ